MPKFDWQARALALEAIVTQLHWAARRYLDGRSTISVHAFNEDTRALLAMGVPLNPTGDGTVWAYDGLSEAEAEEGSLFLYGLGQQMRWNGGTDGTYPVIISSRRYTQGTVSAFAEYLVHPRDTPGTRALACWAYEADLMPWEADATAEPIPLAVGPEERA